MRGEETGEGGCGKPSRAKKVLSNCYSSAMKKRMEQRDRVAATSTARGDQTKLGDAADSGEKDATGPSL